MKLTDRLTRYSKQCIAERLDTDFAEAVQEVVETSREENKNLKEKHMKILAISEMKKVGLLRRDSPLMEVREEEVEEFWNSGAMAAELAILEQKTLQTEKAKYLQSISKVSKRLGFDFTELRLSVRQGKLYIVRPKLIKHHKELFET